MRKTPLILILILFGYLSEAQQDAAQAGWVPLFNGKDFTGWKKLNGEAEYKIEPGGVIVGISKAKTPNTFLATEKNYGDFILELDVWVDNLLNSGVQIRSLSNPGYMNGRVHGYQVEIDPSPRAYSGGLYDEARTMWLYPITRNEESRRAFRTGEWNSYRIEAIGSQIRTWVNGVMCTNLVVDITDQGFIALQVHSVNKPEEVGTQVKWKNIRIKTSDLENSRWPVNPKVPEVSYLVNELTEFEKRHGWRLLWDGKTSTGWKGAKRADFPQQGWQMNDGILTVLATDGRESAGPGDIITTDVFSDLNLSWIL